MKKQLLNYLILVEAFWYSVPGGTTTNYSENSKWTKYKHKRLCVITLCTKNVIHLQHLCDMVTLT